jgi:hypothetical protein
MVRVLLCSVCPSQAQPAHLGASRRISPTTSSSTESLAVSLGSSPIDFASSARSVVVRSLCPSIGVLTDSAVPPPPSRLPNSSLAELCSVPTGLVGPVHVACGFGVLMISPSTSRLTVLVLWDTTDMRRALSSSSWLPAGAYTPSRIGCGFIAQPFNTTMCSYSYLHCS